MKKLIIEIFFFIYKGFVSPLIKLVFGGGCIYRPTCSEYARLSLQKYGFIKGGALSLKRILRCNFFRKSAFDPVP